MIIELDLLIALARKNDRYHNEVVRIFEEKGHEMKLSPYAILEIDLLILSGKLQVKNHTIFLKLLDNTLSYYEVEIVKPTFNHAATA